MSEMLEKILSDENIRFAKKRVYANKGASGVDGVTVRELDEYMAQNWEGIKQQIRERRYRPQPVLRVEIPKPNGGVRKLGIPTVVDRTIEQGITQVLSPIFEPLFSDHSYGFRPNRSCEQAIRKLLEYFNEDYILFKYFKALQDEALNFSVKVTQLMPEDSLEKLHHLYHMADKEPFLLPKNYLQADVQLKDYIAPASFNFKSKYIEVGSCYSSVMFVKRFSYECDDEFITDLLDNTYAAERFAAITVR